MNNAFAQNLLSQINSEYAQQFAGLSTREIFMPAKTMSIKHAEDTRMAMDSTLQNARFYDTIDNMLIPSLGVDGTAGVAFIGYPALAMLVQNPLISIIIQTMTDDAVSRWVELKAKNEKYVKELQYFIDDKEKFNIKDLFRQASNFIGFQGGCMLFVDLGEDDSDLELPITYDDKTITKGKLKGFKLIEPLSTYPAPYEAMYPHKKNYFEPEHYYLQGGVKVHRSRMIKFTSGELPILLKPAYNFYGIPLAQTMLKYIANFERARDAAVHIVENFSLLGLKTNLTQLLNSGDCSVGGATVENILSRIKIMLGSKRNYGVALMDKEEEDFFQINTPLSGLEGMVSLLLELLALVSKRPVTKLFGTPPRGFNATGESDIKNWADNVTSYRNLHFYKPYNLVRRLVELSIFGKVSDNIEEFWLPVAEPSSQEITAINAQKAQSDVALVEANIISPLEARIRLQQDAGSGYAAITPDELPDNFDLEENSDLQNEKY